MNKIWFIAVKELKSFFNSPLAFIVIALMVAIFNVFFYMIIDQSREASLKDVFVVIDFMLVFLAPMLTMRLFSEEKMNGTMEFLMTAPLTKTSIVLGKYLGVLMLFSILIAITLIYYVILEYFGTPDRLVLLTGYLGVWLEGAFFLSIGLLTSAWTRSQVVAAIASFAIIFALYFLPSLAPYLTDSAASVVSQAGTMTHLENLISGHFSVNDIAYYFIGIAVCLSVTRVCIANKH